MKGHAMDGLTVMPGKMASTTTSFPATGMLEIGCHEPGHYEAGMKVVLTVA